MIAQDGETPETWTARRERLKEAKNNGNGCGTPLTMAAAMWPTPQVTTSGMAASNAQVSRVLAGEERERGAGACKLELTAACLSFLPAPETPTPGVPYLQSDPTSPRRLNPLFVEWLMNLSRGWTDPTRSCDATDYARWETASCRLLQHLLSSFSRDGYLSISDEGQMAMDLT
jgi:hypothetical protein